MLYKRNPEELVNNTRPLILILSYEIVYNVLEIFKNKREIPFNNTF